MVEEREVTIVNVPRELAFRVIDVDHPEPLFIPVLVVGGMPLQGAGEHRSQIGYHPIALRIGPILPSPDSCHPSFNFFPASALGLQNLELDLATDRATDWVTVAQVEVDPDVPTQPLDLFPDREVYWPVGVGSLMIQRLNAEGGVGLAWGHADLIHQASPIWCRFPSGTRLSGYNATDGATICPDP
jgi:hypothetical protein